MKFTLTTTCSERGEYWSVSEHETGDSVYSRQIILYPDVAKQTMRGFGGAFTEAAGYALSLLPQEKQKEVIDWYFSKDGLKYSLCRSHMNSCDFSLGNWACVEDPEDKAMESFSMKSDERYLLPMIKAAVECSEKKINLLLSPWSPPAFMKTNGEMNHGGKLKEEFAGMWADCIVRYIKEYRALGFDVRLVSVQNEPEAVQTWDSCIYTAEEEAIFARDHLAPAMKKAGLSDVGIMIWDHNKDRLWDRAMTSLSVDGAAKDIACVGFHWYGGDHFEAVRMVAENYPDKEIYFTEGCVEYSRFADTGSVRKAEMYAHEMIGNAVAGTCGFIDWNMLLDANGGPNHVGNFCEAPIMLTADGGVERKLTYFYIGHFSRFVEEGARLIRHSSFSAEAEAAAFINPSGERVTVVLNRSGEDMPVSLGEGAECCNFVLPAHSVATCCYFAQ